MGCVDELDATFLALKYTLQIDNEHTPQIQSQSYTSRVKLGYQVNLNKLVEQQQQQQILYEPELFCAVRMMKYKPLSVNVFSTGAIVVCGLREPEDIYDIVSDINDVCKPYKQA
jgi:TATA-box binding protein (TBP) (component of TFIID and TFIIIB)